MDYAHFNLTVRLNGADPERIKRVLAVMVNEAFDCDLPPSVFAANSELVAAYTAVSGPLEAEGRAILDIAPNPNAPIRIYNCNPVPGPDHWLYHHDY